MKTREEIERIVEDLKRNSISYQIALTKTDGFDLTKEERTLLLALLIEAFDELEDEE